MPYIGNQHIVGDHINNFKVLDDISSYTETFNGASTNVVSTADNTIRIPEHRFIQGQRVTYTNGGGGNIGGLTSGTAYFVSFDSANTIRLATSLANANSNTVINLSSVGSGTSHTLNAAFDGVNTKFKITYQGGKEGRFNNATQLNVAINNVIQRPNLNPITFTEGFAIEDHHKIKFKVAPTVNDIFWGSIIANTIENFDLRDNEVDNFTGDGSTTEFTLSTIPANNESVVVSIDGVLQHPSDKNVVRAYTLIDSVIQFTAAPALNAEIQVRHIGFAGPSTNDVSGFYGRTGNVALTANDHITTGDITARNFKATGITTFSGNVSIGGTLTYEDVTNIDSVGIITARDGIDCNGDLSVAGVTTITSSTYPLNVHADTAYQGILVNGNNAPTIGFNVGNNATPSWKLGLHGGSHLNFALSTGAGNSNKLVIQGASNGGKGLFTGEWYATNLSSHTGLHQYDDTDTRISFGHPSGATDTINLQTGGSTRLKIENSGVIVTGVSTHNDHVQIIDGKRLKVGSATNGDLILLHDGTDSIIDNATGNLFYRSATHKLQAINGHNMIVGNTGGSVELYHNNTKRFETFDNNPFVGISVTNDVVLNGSGDTAYRWAVGGNASSNFKWSMYYANVDGALRIFDNVNSRPVMVWKNTGAIELNHQANKKLETTSSGIEVTGKVTANHSNGQVVLQSTDGSIELTRTAGGAYIDFKNSTSEDYDARINEEGGHLRVSTHFRLYDNKALELGNRTSSTYGDLRLFHDASDSYIQNHTGVFFIQNTGDLRIRVDDTDAAIHCVRNGAVELHHAGNKKFETSSTGAILTGDLLIGTTSWNYKKQLNVQGSSGSIISIFNGDTTTYAANTNSSIEFKLKTGSSTNQETACEIRGFKENGTDGNSARGLSFYTGESGASPAERLRITSYGDVYSANSAYNTYDTAATSVETVTQNNQNRAGVYWLNFNGVKFRAYVKPNWLQGRNWVLAAKYFDPQDMPSGSSLWTNDTYVNESDFNLYGGLMSKYRSWRYFSFNRLAMQMGNRIPPIMQFNSNQTLYGAFSGGYASNGGGVTADSTDPAMSGTTVRYHDMNNYAGPDFHDVNGLEDRMQSYGLNKWANNAANSTSGNNQGSENYYPQHRIEAGGGQSADHSLDVESVKGYRMTTEDSHPNIGGIASLGRAGAWIGCPLDEGNSQQGSAGSNVGADSGFGMGGCSGNNARTWTSGYAEWNLGNSVVNCLPAYIWLSID